MPDSKTFGRWWNEIINIIANLPAGMYVVLSQSGKTYSAKLVKE